MNQQQEIIIDWLYGRAHRTNGKIMPSKRTELKGNILAFIIIPDRKSVLVEVGVEQFLLHFIDSASSLDIWQTTAYADLAIPRYTRPGLIRPSDSDIAEHIINMVRDFAKRNTGPTAQEQAALTELKRQADWFMVAVKQHETLLASARSTLKELEEKIRDIEYPEGKRS